jgi:hypothetical protein
MDPQHGLDVVGREVRSAQAEVPGDPVRLCRELILLDVVVSAAPIEHHDRDEPAARHEPDDQEPPLELGHPPESRTGRRARPRLDSVR